MRSRIAGCGKSARCMGSGPIICLLGCSAGAGPKVPQLDHDVLPALRTKYCEVSSMNSQLEPLTRLLEY